MIKETRTIKGYYGSENTPCNIFVYKGWYCVEDSKNVNHCNDELLVLGVDVETLQDDDMFSSQEPINSEEELKDFIDN